MGVTLFSYYQPFHYNIINVTNSLEYIKLKLLVCYYVERINKSMILYRNWPIPSVTQRKYST